MSKFCPITNERVIYLYCQECEEKLCENVNNNLQGILVEEKNYEVYNKFNQNRNRSKKD